MARKDQNARIQFKYSTLSGVTPTIAPSTDHTDGSWTSTDLYVGEFMLNAYDDTLWIRTLNGIIPITSGSTSINISTYVNKTGDTMTGTLYSPQFNSNLFSGGTFSGTTFSGGTFYGDGSNLTNLPTTTFTGGTINGNTTFTSLVDLLNAGVFIDTIDSNGGVLSILGGLNVSSGVTIGYGMGSSVVDINGVVSATTYYGDGSNLTNLQSPSAIFTGGTINGFTQFTNGLQSNTILSTSVTATTFYGDGSQLTGLPSSTFTGGTISGFTQFTNGVNVDVLSATTLFGDGSNLTNLPTGNNYYTTGLTINNGKVDFNRTDTLSAYTLSFSGININVLTDNVNKIITFSGNTGGISSGGTGIVTSSVTYSSLVTLKNNSGITRDVIYHLTDKDIYLIGEDVNSLSLEGIRHQRIVKDIYYTYAGTNFGYVSGYRTTNPNIGDIAVFCNQLYVNNNGSVGTISIPSTTGLTGPSWTFIPYTDDKYYSKYFNIVYRFDDDIIVSQSDDRGNTIWWSPYGDFTTITDWGCVDITYNSVNGIYANSNDDGSRVIISNNSGKQSIIYWNTGSNNEISLNEMNGDIVSNRMSGQIQYNKSFNSISSNESNSILFNTGYGFGSIINNSNCSILNNEIDGDINNNTYVTIGYNKCLGNINNNTSYEIKYNHIRLNGITDNTNTGVINSNRCQYISNNSITGDIINNDVDFIDSNS